jgi:hypothetical protein
MIIDPDRDGCTVWHGDKVQHIKGSPCECVEMLVIYFMMHNINVKTKCIIGLDITGEYGIAFAKIMQSFGIQFYEIKGQQFIIKRIGAII